jgi:UDP-N-acetylmuramate: L-alanyl-gamma-D-glutamyl-meso-diaminopimelate ligase
MPKEYFSVKNISSLASLKPGARIHVIGVAGVAMAQLAILLTDQGFNVSGSDKEFYEPMGGLLKKSKVQLFEGYSASNISSDVDLVVIGNAVSYGHPEVAICEERVLPYTCFPAALYEAVIKGHHSIVIAGTHGKSTTTAMVASTLSKMGESPSYFVGGVAQDLPSGLARGDGRFSVVEGDEYDSAFFAKIPKFKFYKPDTAIINAIEFDHGDIYPNLDAIKREFDDLVEAVPADGLIVACTDFEEVKKAIPSWQIKTKARIVTFGEDDSATYRITSRSPNGGFQVVTVKSPTGKILINVPAIGSYNARNALATVIALTEQGFKLDRVLEALKTFRSVKRRQEIIYADDRVAILEDFAHHPTAVSQTLRAVAETFPGYEIWAAFEPRSATSRRKIFQDEYIEALKSANRVFIKTVESRGAVDSGIEFMDVDVMCESLRNYKVEATALLNGDAIFAELTKASQKQRIIVLMSNGAFDNLPKRLSDFFKGQS